jgi:Cu/Ag efflux protein CusF
MIKNLTAALLGAALALSAVAQEALSEGEVRKVDKSTGKITLKHGDIKNLDMPPMTMVFAVTDKALLDKVKAGDKVRFAADKDATGQYIVTSIEPRN